MAPFVPRPAEPCFMFLCIDGPAAPALRTRDLDAHLAHVEAYWDRYIIAGPTRAPGEDALDGSLFLVYAPTIDDAWALMRKDPYFTNGQYARIEARAFTPAIGAAIGGKTWRDADSVRDRAAGGPPLSSLS
ncbi:MAG: YciI family protein [Alphaproteobacteria bacterium]|nr:YciI family protein [Alphaproteobacteria bacterium]